MQQWLNGHEQGEKEKNSREKLSSSTTDLTKSNPQLNVRICSEEPVS
jgi:hypothetical protein